MMTHPKVDSKEVYAQKPKWELRPLRLLLSLGIRKAKVLRLQA